MSAAAGAAARSRLPRREKPCGRRQYYARMRIRRPLLVGERKKVVQRHEMGEGASSQGVFAGPPLTHFVPGQHRAALSREGRGRRDDGCFGVGLVWCGGWRVPTNRVQACGGAMPGVKISAHELGGRSTAGISAKRTQPTKARPCGGRPTFWSNQPKQRKPRSVAGCVATVTGN